MVKTKTFKVMPFGLKNAPAFYTAMMQFLRDEWILLFNETRHIISLINSPAKVIYNDRIIIDDILLFSNHTPTFLYYFSCVTRVFTKYRLSFKLSKWDFFKDRMECVGHDLTSNRNYSAKSKFSLIQDWSLPPHEITLLSFIGLYYVYHKYCPWFKTNIKPLRKLQRAYHRKDIPIMGWTFPLINFFCDCKTHLVTSPLLLRFDNRCGYFFSTQHCIYHTYSIRPLSLPGSVLYWITIPTSRLARFSFTNHFGSTRWDYLLIIWFRPVFLWI